MTVYFISDLHLNPERPATMQMLHNFLRNFGKTASAIYILGDLFDYWAGDDLSCSQFVVTIQLLNETSKYAKIYFMHGNRDFLISDDFARQTNCTILPDPYLIHLDTHKILLAHGDAFCTFDKKYQLFRTIIRSKLSKIIYSAMPRVFRESLVNDLRNFSKQQNKQKVKYTPQIFAVNPATLAKYVNKYSADTIIYGHVHTRKMEDLNHNNVTFKHIVLPDWQDTSAQVLCYADNNFSFIEIS
jgi:UDP-2,3-diacylglucosamine hydrolase